MRRLVSRRPSGTTLIALLALVMACTGSAVAASLITSKQIKDGTIQTKDISKKALKALKGKSGVQGAQGLQGPKGEQGAKGDKGDTGPATGAAGGDLAGDYPNPSIKDGAVGSQKLGSLPQAEGATTANMAGDSERQDTKKRQGG